MDKEILQTAINNVKASLGEGDDKSVKNLIALVKAEYERLTS